MNLQDLIADRKDGRSYEALATACGGTPAAKRLQQIATTPLRAFPDPDSIRGLARGLRVGERAIVLAAAESLHLDVNAGAPFLEWLPGSLDELSRDQVDALLAVVRVMLDDARRARNEAAHGEPAALEVDELVRLVAFADEVAADDSDRRRHLVSAGYRVLLAMEPALRPQVPLNALLLSAEEHEQLRRGFMSSSSAPDTPPSAASRPPTGEGQGSSQP